MSVIENEIRGELSNEKSIELLNFLNQNANKLKEFKRLTVKFFNEGIETSKIDLRLRIQETHTEIVLKIGGFGDADRQEIPVKIENESFTNAYKMLNALGFQNICAFWRFTTNYEYKGVEVAIVEAPNFGKYFELEVSSNEEEKEDAMKKLVEVKNELGLEEFENNEALYAYIKQLDENCNIICPANDIKIEELLDFNSLVWKK